MAIPNLVADVEAARQKYPEAWRNAHTNNAHTEDFIRLFARDVRAKHGPKWGLNGKRGNPNDISDDVLTYAGEGSAIDAVNGGPMEIIDVIGGAGGPNPQPAWNVGPGGPGDKGTVISTFTVPGDPGVPGPVPKPCPDPSAHIPKPPLRFDRAEMFDALKYLDNDLYTKPEGLNRAGGLVINGRADLEGFAAWMFDVYLNARLDGKSHQQGKDAMRASIRNSDEWRQKHPGETP